MKKGAIIIHGLTGTPATMAPLTEALSRAGFKVVTPLLPGHGTTKEELREKKWEEWTEKVAGEYERLRNDVDKIYCAGLSLGSVLSLYLAAKVKVEKVACLGLPLKLSSLLENFLLPVSHVPPLRQLLKYSKKDWKASVRNEIGRDIYKGGSYDAIPVPSVWELQKLQKVVKTRLAAYSTPTLLVHSRHDKVAPPSNVRLFLAMARNTKAEVVWLDNSGHVVTLDHDKDIVCERVVSFFS
jgi:carboxylesterase